MLGDPNGIGSYTAPDGHALQGNFVNGKLDGLVLVTGNDGQQRIETWVDGEIAK